MCPALSPPPPPLVLPGPAAAVRACVRACLQWHRPVWRQSGRRSGAGGGAGRPAGGDAGAGATTGRGRLEKRRRCPQRAGRRRWQGGQRPLADGAEPPGRREAQPVQVSDGPTASRAPALGPAPARVDSGTPGMPAAAPKGPSSAPGSSHPFMRRPIVLAISTANSHQRRLSSPAAAAHQSLPVARGPGHIIFCPRGNSISVLGGIPSSPGRRPRIGSQVAPPQAAGTQRFSPWARPPPVPVPLICHPPPGLPLTASRWL